MGLLSLLSVMPLTAQIVNGVDFATSSPFYVGNAKMPAGSYKITKSDMDESILQIQSKDGVHSALIEFIPTFCATSSPLRCHLPQIRRHRVPKPDLGPRSGIWNEG
jgi:hypothetical protein